MSPSAKRKSPKPKLLSGDNPQIAKGYGNAPVRAYIAAIPGWKRAVARRVDTLVVRSVPFTKYVKVTFFRGSSLEPVPPGESKQKEVRYLDIREDDKLDEAQVIAWVKQASELPGEKM